MFRPNQCERKLYSLIGNRVGSYNSGTVDGLQNERLDVSGLSEGLYLLRINAELDRITQKIRIVK
ncbi:MAG: T9SS type A sorting domain-containing protein [Bacteroidales bacterium]|nr:T9SS type A sorting domain-containing protein [Bacteroidales bacterium]MCF8345221.1 T9SS type A sorting domain-containing protein [Bacteroidales bacterium]MCF8351180.1 T9SS type A sorting domain-containing protein [Bacteroidales bacterium]MCF8377700.1 T9SS type A sorting domain-containing protein [Bacteroidales bacterium]